MDPNNISGISISDDLDESDFSAVSSVGTDLKQILKKLKKLEAKSTMNEGGSFSMLQIGEKIGELRKEMEVMKATKHVDIGTFNGLKEKVEKLGQANQKLAEENQKMKKEFEGKIDEKDRQMDQEVKKMADELVKKDQMMDGLKELIDRLNKECEKLSQKNGQLKNGMKEFAEKNAEMMKEFEEKIEEKDRQMKKENRKLGEKVEKLKADFEGNGRAIDGLKGQIDGLKEENGNLGRELRQILGQKAEKEEFATLAGRIADSELRFKWEIIEMNGNKFGADCGPKLAIFEGGRVVKHLGPNNGDNCVRAQMPIKFNSNTNKSAIVYFEVEIVAKTPNCDCIDIGFCTQQFPLEDNWLGEMQMQNSIGIFDKEGINIDDGETGTENGNDDDDDDDDFQVGEVIGIGIVHYPAIFMLKCFSTCNGNLLQFADLPPKFAALELYPAITMKNVGDSIRANFGSDAWKYNPAAFSQCNSPIEMKAAK